MNNTDFFKSLIAIAQSDFVASKILYDSGSYLQSTFYLQQGIEKANKVFGLFGNFFEAAESKQLGHDHTKLHKKVINHQIEQVKLFNDKRAEVKPFVDAITKELDFDYDKYIKTLESARHIKDQMKEFNIITITEDELLEVIEEIQAVNEKPYLEIDKEALIKEFKEKSSEFISSLFHNLLPANPNIDIVKVEEVFKMPETLEIMAEAMLKAMNFQKTLYEPFLQIYMLGFITADLVSVRYPDVETNIDPLKMFTNNHPIIKYQPTLHKIASNAFNKLVILMEESYN